MPLQYGCLVDQPYLLGKVGTDRKKTRDCIFLPTTTRTDWNVYMNIYIHIHTYTHMLYIYIYVAVKSVA